MYDIFLIFGICVVISSNLGKIFQKIVHPIKKSYMASVALLSTKKSPKGKPSGLSLSMQGLHPTQNIQRFITVQW